MKTSIGHTSTLLDFLDVGFSSNQISDLIKEELDAILSTLKLDHDLDDWTLVIRASYTNARQPLVSKNKLGAFTSDRIKEITIIIPIPTLEFISWGVHANQHIFGASHFDKLVKNFNPIDLDYKQFENRTDYILDCMRMGINLSFENGFTVRNKKIRKIQ